ncbi:unnamed protein product [Pseudo-nitzschia multistriata]|uniref:Uncharacterized protein n=1 Tax=Pseudo-nitzschia multistriata TaxID=183589 RepID=A0A448ZNJ1_9STRA|nr:unnamed protein product [Pseudo-nitzschia multistriata]
MSTRTHESTDDARNDDVPVTSRLAELEVRRKMLVSAMSKFRDTRNSELFRVLRSNDSEDSRGPSSGSNIRDDPGGNDVGSDGFPSDAAFTTTRNFNEKSKEKVHFAKKKTQLLSSLYRRQSLSKADHTTAEEETQCFLSVVEGDGECDKRKSIPSARPVLMALSSRTDQRQNYQTCAAASIEKTEKYSKSKTQTIDNIVPDIQENRNMGLVQVEERRHEPVKQNYDFENTIPVGESSEGDTSISERKMNLSPQNMGLDENVGPDLGIVLDKDFDTALNNRDRKESSEIINYNSLDFEALMQDSITHASSDQTATEESIQPDSISDDGCESNFDIELEKKLDLMILENPLWRKAMQDTYTKEDISATQKVGESKTSTPTDLIEGSGGSSKIFDESNVVNDKQKKEMKKEPYTAVQYLQSNQWSCVRPDAGDLETPLASNVRKPDQDGVGVTKGFSKYPSRSQPTSLPTLHSKDDGNGNATNVDEEYSGNNSANPLDLPRFPAISTDFTVDSIALTSTVQTNVESLGDESLVTRNMINAGTDPLSRDSEDTGRVVDENSTFSTKAIQGFCADDIKKFFAKPSILFQCTGPVAIHSVSSPSHGIFGDTGSETEKR